MNQTGLQSLLSDLPLGGVRYFATLGSTNEFAKRWADQSAPALSLVVADEQTAGRGRLQRRWFTPRGAALAFSLILIPRIGRGQDGILPYRYTALGALATCEALNTLLPPGNPAQIKWPNDVIVSRRKLAGVLAEAGWQGEQLDTVILGIGINVAPSAVPPDEVLHYPATCVEAEAGAPVERWELLHAVLERLLFWNARLDTPEFLEAWNDRLALRDEWVQVTFDDGSPLEGQVLGLSEDGCLRLRDRQGKTHELTGGELNVRPVGRS